MADLAFETQVSRERLANATEQLEQMYLQDCAKNRRRLRRE